MPTGNSTKGASACASLPGSLPPAVKYSSYLQLPSFLKHIKLPNSLEVMCDDFPLLFQLALNSCHIVIKTSYERQIRNYPCTEITLQVEKFCFVVFFLDAELAVKLGTKTFQQCNSSGWDGVNFPPSSLWSAMVCN